MLFFVLGDIQETSPKFIKKLGLRHKYLVEGKYDSHSRTQAQFSVVKKLKSALRLTNIDSFVDIPLNSQYKRKTQQSSCSGAVRMTEKYFTI